MTSCRAHRGRRTLLCTEEKHSLYSQVLGVFPKCPSTFGHLLSRVACLKADLVLVQFVQRPWRRIACEGKPRNFLPPEV